jgi:peptide/nickel transport system permease protein
MATLPERASAAVAPASVPAPSRWFRLLRHDPFATASLVFLVVLVACAVLGPWLLGDAGTRQNLRLRNAPPLSIQHGWLYALGADTLGRSMLGRLILASRNTLTIAAAAMAGSLVVGAALGLLAGYARGWVGDLVLRLTDIVMSFPSLLMAVVILYMFEPSVLNVVLVLAITRLPVYIRTTRAEVLELKQRSFVSAAKVMGASPVRIALRHVLPMVVPTLTTLATVEFAYVMLAESGLSFLGIGIQPPEVSWGLMVAQGRNYLGTAWWLAFLPGLAIMFTTLAINLAASWLRVATDPQQRWRLEGLR